MDCALSIVTTEGYALDVPLVTAAGERRLPRGSLVRPVPGACDATVEVLSTAGWYAGTAAPGDTGCISPTALAPAADLRFVALRDGIVPAGTVLDSPVGCEVDLSTIRAVDAATLARVEMVRAEYARLFGPIGLHQVPWSDWGYVGLPLPVIYSPERIAAEIARENLSTPDQRERAIVAEGPGYAHFWGADAAFSDIWARPETITALLGVVAGWRAVCGESPACTLQIGDLAWYNPARPDPLGHKDHSDGRCVDLRLFRTDGARYEAWWNRPDDRTGERAYDAVRTGDFLAWVTTHAHVTDLFFNDSTVRRRVPLVKPLSGHDDHVHLCLE